MDSRLLLPACSRIVTLLSPCPHEDVHLIDPVQQRLGHRPARLPARGPAALLAGLPAVSAAQKILFSNQSRYMYFPPASSYLLLPCPLSSSLVSSSAGSTGILLSTCRSSSNWSITSLYLWHTIGEHYDKFHICS